MERGNTWNQTWFPRAAIATETRQKSNATVKITAIYFIKINSLPRRLLTIKR